MIITRLRGGLGNQLFQYACGRALSLRTGNPLKLDVSGYEKGVQERNRADTQRAYSLSHFTIEENIASAEEIRALKYPLGIVSKGWRFVKVKIFRQFNTGFIPRILSKTGDIYLDGYWQTEIYFRDHENKIRQDITLKEPLSPAAAAIALDIQKTVSVSIHIRRGDVARDAATNPYFGICTPEYYGAALNYMNEHVEDPHVFIFSDDPDWVRQNIKIPQPFTFISDKNPDGSLRDYEELILMSLCRHNVIANSSFSWWGAWLNANPDKVVVAPKAWITGAGRDKRLHKDTVPSTWIRL
jgi:hypothetical protein